MKDFINLMDMLTFKAFKKVTGIHITNNHSGKMDGMQSISTSPFLNRQCEKNATICGSICEHCFSRKQCKTWPSMKKPLEKNFEILTTRILSDCELPIINALYFRFEAFGDLASDIQVINYFNIAKANPQTHFALWTKNARFIKKAMDNGHEKPENLNIIYSSLFVNDCADIERIKKRYPFIDKVFTVYDEEHGANVAINCGAKSCLKCRLCYEKNGVQYINELIK